MRYQYRDFFEGKLRELAKGRIVLDVGGGNPFQKEMKGYRDLFKESFYLTLDFSTLYQPTVVGDIHCLPLINERVDAILCKAVLEHVSDPKKAVEEMYRCLKKGGKILVYVPAIYPYHARVGVYPDNYRFFEDGLRYLFRNFQALEICKIGGYFETLMYFLPFQDKLRPFLQSIFYIVDRMLGTDKRTVTSGYYLYGKK